jgi:20S proteasome subunit beta 1
MAFLNTSSFIGREILNPSGVMESSFDSGGGAPEPMGAPDSSLDFLKEEVDLGTSIMAVAFDGGVVLGADSRVSTG